MVLNNFENSRETKSWEFYVSFKNRFTCNSLEYHIRENVYVKDDMELKTNREISSCDISV